jgi:hypothetical protein
MKKFGVSNSVGCGSHRFDADPYIRISILTPIQIRIRICIILQILNMLENRNFFDFYSQQSKSTLFHLSHQRHRRHNFQNIG